MIIIKRLNEIIDRYKENKELYEVLKQFYLENDVTVKEAIETLNKIKRIITNYYLSIYEFKSYSSGKVQDPLLINIFRLCDLTKKIKYHNGKAKIYPIKESTENKERIYQKIIEELVDYQIENNISTEEAFNIFAQRIENEINKVKQKLKQDDMELYYGSIYYMVERSLFIIECIKLIPNKELSLDDIKNIMLYYKQRYIDTNPETAQYEDVSNVDDEFYVDYDLIESLYKKLIAMENELSPIVTEEWKKYLTSPDTDNENYRYVMHCFTSGMVDPCLMNKACCSLYTPEIENSMYGNSGLIYDIDVDSVDTMCTEDVGSWTINKEEFIERECPSRWQLTSLDRNTLWYEYPLNSKLILPSVFEAECINSIKNGKFNYSEICLNKNARPVGVFYTEECQDVKEVELYASKYNLPLIKIPAKKIQQKI